MANRKAVLLGSVCVGFALGGAAPAVVQLQRSGLPAVDGLSLALVWPGAVGGALVAHALWALYTGQVSRATRVLVVLNCVAWAGYLVFTPQLTEVELANLQRLRDELNTSLGINFIEDGPSVLAGRPSGYWPVNFSHWVLSLFAGPSLEYSEYLVAERKNGGPAYVSESYAIAALSFIYSSAFWAAVAPSLGFMRHLLRRLTTACSRRQPGES